MSLWQVVSCSLASQSLARGQYKIAYMCSRHNQYCAKRLSTQVYGFLLVSGVGCDFCLWLFLDFSVYLFDRAIMVHVDVTAFIDWEPRWWCCRLARLSYNVALMNNSLGIKFVLPLCLVFLSDKSRLDFSIISIMLHNLCRAPVA